MANMAIYLPDKIPQRPRDANAEDFGAMTASSAIVFVTADAVKRMQPDLQASPDPPAERIPQDPATITTRRPRGSTRGAESQHIYAADL